MSQVFFWCTMNMSLFTVMLLFYNFFFDVFIVNFKQILHLDLLFSVTSSVLSPEAATRGVL